MKCYICKETIKGFGNNSMPISTAESCNKCNDNVIVPYRYYLRVKEDSALLIKTDLSLNIVKPKDDEFSLKELQLLVDGYIEYYPFSDDVYKVIVNEEGLVRELKFNELAEKLLSIKAYGDVLIVPNTLLK